MDVAKFAKEVMAIVEDAYHAGRTDWIIGKRQIEVSPKFEARVMKAFAELAATSANAPEPLPAEPKGEAESVDE